MLHFSLFIRQTQIKFLCFPQTNGQISSNVNWNSIITMSLKLNQNVSMPKFGIILTRSIFKTFCIMNIITICCKVIRNTSYRSNFYIFLFEYKFWMREKIIFLQLGFHDVKKKKVVDLIKLISCI